MLKVTATFLALVTVAVLALPPAAAQIGIPSPLPLPGVGPRATPVVSYVWYDPARAEVESGRGFEVSTVFPLLGPIKGRLQYAWPQSGDYSNIGLAGIMTFGRSLYAGAGYERTRGRETTPVVREITEYQPYAFVGVKSQGQLYSMLLEAERGFGDDLRGTTLKVGIGMTF